MGTLYIVSTPIGNSQDISYRAVKLLTSIAYIACEDTRRTGLFLKRISEEILHEPMKTRPFFISYYEHNEKERIPNIITVLKNGFDVALVSDAGTPAVSDPGFKLIRECVRQNIPIQSVPGPSSVLTALVVSGLPTDKFLFLGYLPHKKSHAKKLLENVSQSLGYVKSTVIIFVAPHKLLRTLEAMKDVLGDIDIVICRELTKVHEEILRMKISECLKHFQKLQPKGEFVILF